MAAPKKDGPLRVKKISIGMTIDEFRDLQKLTKKEGRAAADIVRELIREKAAQRP